MSRTVSVIATLMCLWLFHGCRKDNYETVPTHPASGKLTINGVPALGAVVTLHPEAPQPGAKYPLLPAGRVKEDGTFQLTTFANNDGAPPGNYVITIEWPDPNWRPPGGGLPPPPPDRLMEKFANPQKSNFKTTVREGDNQLDPIVLEKAQILKGSSLK